MRSRRTSVVTRNYFSTTHCWRIFSTRCRRAVVLESFASRLHRPNYVTYFLFGARSHSRKSSAWGSRRQCNSRPSLGAVAPRPSPSPHHPETLTLRDIVGEVITLFTNRSDVFFSNVLLNSPPSLRLRLSSEISTLIVR